MIQLYEGTNGNECVFTLNENTTIEAPIYYLFEFIKEDTNVSVTFLATDLTWNRIRFNLFNIELVEEINIDFTNSKINLKSGRYKYNIYQQHSSSNLIPAAAISIIERGFVEVNIPIEDIAYDEQSKINITYNG